MQKEQYMDSILLLFMAIQNSLNYKQVRTRSACEKIRDVHFISFELLSTSKNVKWGTCECTLAVYFTGEYMVIDFL